MRGEPLQPIHLTLDELHQPILVVIKDTRALTVLFFNLAGQQQILTYQHEMLWHPLDTNIIALVKVKIHVD